MENFAKTFICLFLLLAVSVSVKAADAELVSKKLYGRYEGTFEWYDGSLKDDVVIVLNKVNTDNNNFVVASGTGEYLSPTGDKPPVRFEVLIKINPASNGFEMWEMNPVGSESFETNGSHVGLVSKDFKIIHATWTSVRTGKKGSLKLKAITKPRI